MLTLSQDDAPKALDGRITRTTQRGKRRWKSLGWVRHPVQAAAFGDVVGHVRIVAVRPILLGHVTEEMAKEEGFASLAAFRRSWRERYGCWRARLPVWDIRFRPLLASGEMQQSTLFDGEEVTPHGD